MASKSKRDERLSVETAIPLFVTVFLLAYAVFAFLHSNRGVEPCTTRQQSRF
jgi:hypothetical protein